MSITFHFSPHLMPPPPYIPPDSPMYDITIEDMTKNNNTTGKITGVWPFRASLILERGRTNAIPESAVVEHFQLAQLGAQYGFIGRFCSYPLWESEVQLNGVDVEFHVTAYTGTTTDTSRGVTIIYPLLYAWTPIGESWEPSGGTATLLYNWYEHYPDFVFSPLLQPAGGGTFFPYNFKNTITIDHSYVIQRYDRLILEWWYITSVRFELTSEKIWVRSFGIQLNEGRHPTFQYNGFMTFNADIIDLERSKAQALFPYDVNKGIQHARSH